MGVGKAIGLGVLAGFVVWFFTPWLLDPGWILLVNGILFLTAAAMSAVGLVSRIIPRATGELLTLAIAALVLQLLSWIFLDPLDLGQNGWGMVALVLSGSLTWAFLGPLVLSEENAFGAIGMMGTTFSAPSMIFLEPYLEALWMLPLLVIFLIQVIGWMRPINTTSNRTNRKSRKRNWKAGYEAGYVDGRRDSGRRKRRSR